MDGIILAAVAGFSCIIIICGVAAGKEIANFLCFWDTEPTKEEVEYEFKKMLKKEFKDDKKNKEVL